MDYRIFVFYVMYIYKWPSCTADEISNVPKYSTPVSSAEIYFAEHFDSNEALQRWIPSKATKGGVDSDIAKYDGHWQVASSLENALSGDSGLLLKDKARHHAISTKLDRPYNFYDKPFIMQYEVNFQAGVECGGAYVKLLSYADDLDLENFQDQTPYTIMFGPDKCGEDYKVHFIFRHKNPISEVFEEKHAKKTNTHFKTHFTDKASHLYTLIVNPDNSFKIYIDQYEINSGNLLNDFSPPVNPPKTIKDKDDRKPEDWDEREKIADPDSKKPDDWDEEAPPKIVDLDAKIPDDWLEDEPPYVVDHDAFKPEDWDDEMDGEWEAPNMENPRCEKVSGCGIWEPPMIDNPSYKGKWKAPQITNPNYKGIWKPRMVPNPHYFVDMEPFKMTSIGAVGFELWSMSEDILFDNIIITDDKNIADDHAERTWKLKKTMTEHGFVRSLLNTAEKKPWLWFVFTLVVGLPLVLIYSFCCSSKKKVDPKKTDESTPDDSHDSKAEEEEETDKNGESKLEEEEAENEGAGDRSQLTEENFGKENAEPEVLEGEDNTAVRELPRKRKAHRIEN